MVWLKLALEIIAESCCSLLQKFTFCCFFYCILILSISMNESAHIRKTNSCDDTLLAYAIIFYLLLLCGTWSKCRKHCVCVVFSSCIRSINSFVIVWIECCPNNNRAAFSEKLVCFWQIAKWPGFFLAYKFPGTGSVGKGCYIWKIVTNVQCQQWAFAIRNVVVWNAFKVLNNVK